MSDAVNFEVRDAARHLERHTFLTQARHPDVFLLVRRNSTELKRRFGETVGYRLVVESTFARLLKPPLPGTSPVRALTGPNGPVTPRVYQYICLLAAALQAPGAADQWLISALVAQVYSDAATAGIATGESHSERRDLATAVTLLAGFGVVEETEGSASAWGAGQDPEVLLTVNQTALSYLLANPVIGETRTDRPARTLARRLVEDPILDRALLTPEEDRIWSRDRATLEDHLDELFGLHLEVRREGALAWDVAEDATDEPFPGQGLPRQLALMFLTELARIRNTGSGGVVTVTDETVDQIIATMLDTYRGHLTLEFDPSDPAAPLRVKATVSRILCAVGLLTIGSGIFTLHPAAARYRAAITRRSAPMKVDAETVVELSLFDVLEEGS
ncbi:DUF2398 family protein [Cryobacterium frigoriphilum]|uniref:DUF2398 family protein n=1 Tax=Cryobacterium frigoriphilum TaxID=1259150 RepID=A0A4R8ZZS1_9MICO|nr:DUF2398 family protein [Cryobacterium frigoriphilum]TFD49619.1 DUF2398 family protein [Cryobacterium frigoriphilum]